MEWIEVSVITTSEAVELVTGLMMSYNIPNVRIIDDEAVGRFLLDHPLNWDYKDDTADYKKGAEIIFYLQDDEIQQRRLLEIEKALYEMIKNIPEIDFGAMKINKGPVNDDDWLHEWKKTYKTFTVGKNIIIRPVWEDYNVSKGETVFTIDPGAVFGTGLHETTQLCIMALENLNSLKNAAVLDIGCGSGILSLIALLLGAGSAVACDIDPGAVRCATENARLNNIDTSRYTVYGCNIFEDDDFIQGTKFDVILANIVADVIIRLAPLVKKYLRANGTFIASGIIDERSNEVCENLKQNGFVVRELCQMDGWHCIVVENA